MGCCIGRCVMRRMTLVVVFLLTSVLAFAEMPSEENIKAVAESWLVEESAAGAGGGGGVCDGVGGGRCPRKRGPGSAGGPVGPEGDPSVHRTSRPGFRSSGEPGRSEPAGGQRRCPAWRSGRFHFPARDSGAP